jgi:hypothetical protein
MRSSTGALVGAGFLALSVACGHSPTEPTLGASYSATVSGQRARFVFPLESQSVWEWNRASTQANALEYMWAVELRNAGSSYQFGFFHFKFLGSESQHGDLQSLLQAGQWSVFRSGTLVAGAVSVSYEPSSLVIAVNDARTFQLLLSERPRQATFRVELPGTPGTHGVVAVQYE